MYNRVTFLFVFIYLLYTFIFDSLSSAGFECSKATTKVEFMICNNDHISAIDYELGYYYKMLLNISDDPEIERKKQYHWLGIRNKCNNVKCLNEIYEKRLEGLELFFKNLVINRKESLRIEDYYLEENLFGYTGNGPDISLGKYFSCLRIKKYKSISFINFDSKMPDSSEYLMIDTPVIINNDDRFTFSFVDNWSNRGKGTFYKQNKHFIINLDVVERSSNPYHNVLRQYGKHKLFKQQCKIPYN